MNSLFSLKNPLKIKNLTILILAAFMIFSPLQSHARQIIFDGEVNFSEETKDENYYFAGFNVNINSNFTRDLVLLGGRVNVFGEVVQDVLVFGGEVNLVNYTQGDLRVFGGTVNVSSTIEGDLVLVGGNIVLNENAEIRGSTIIIGGQVTQNSKLASETDIVAASVTLNSEVAGNAEITTQRITFAENSIISGVLHYFAPDRAIERSGSEITGNVNFNQINTIRETGFVKTIIINVMSFWIILRFITTLILAFLLIQLFKVFSQETNDLATKSVFKSFLAGFLSLFLVPLIFSVLLVSLIGLPIGILLILIYIIILSISPAIAGIFVGNLVSSLRKGKTINSEETNIKTSKPTQVNFHNAVIGIVLLTVLQFVDWLGDITIIFFNLVATGAIIRYIIINVFSKK